MSSDPARRRANAQHPDPCRDRARLAGTGRGPLTAFPLDWTPRRMAPMDELPELRAAVPALEPDPVLLGRLVELSAAGAAADTAARARLRPARALITGAAALGLVAATSWVAGGLPGGPSPIEPNEAPTPAPTAPVTPHRTGDASVPSASAGPTSGASHPHTE